MTLAKEKNTQAGAIREPKSILGAKPLLFDRLIDNDTGNFFEQGTEYYLSRQQVEESIQLEIGRLLNTRRAEGYSNAKNEVAKNHSKNLSFPSLYGLPDFHSYDATNPNDWPLIAGLMKTAIDYFEPRLQKATVEIVYFDNNRQSLDVAISGTLTLFKEKGEVTFNVVIDCSPKLDR